MRTTLLTCPVTSVPNNDQARLGYRGLYTQHGTKDMLHIQYSAVHIMAHYGTGVLWDSGYYETHLPNLKQLLRTIRFSECAIC